MQRRRAVQQHRVFADHLFEDVPHLRPLLLDHLLRLLDRGDELSFFELVVDERLEQLERHLLRQTALMQLQLRSDDDDRTARVVHALAEQVLTEPALLALERVGQRLQRTVVRPAQDTTAAAVVEERIDRFLQHALFVADDDVRRLELHQLLQPVVAVDDAAIEVVQVRRREPAAVERDERTQLRRNHRNDIENHPVRLVVRLAEAVDHLQPLGVLQLLLDRVLGAHLHAQLFGQLLDVDAAQQLLDRLGAHLRAELRPVVLAGLAELLLVEQLVLLELRLTRIDDDVALEVEDALEIAQGDVEQVADAARQPLEEPHVADRRGQRDVAEALAPHLGLRDLDAALVADHAAVLHALVLAAQALPVGDRPEDLGAEQAVAFRLERAVVDRLGLGDLAERPRHDLLRRSQRDPDRIEVGAERRFRIVEAWSHLHGLQYGFTFIRGQRFGRLPLGVDQLNIETERLQLANEHVERLGQPWRERRVALDDRLVDLGASGDVVRFRREQLLEDVRRPIRLERPDLHLSKALAAELGLAAQRLLRDERVGADRPRVDLVVDQVRQLEHVDVADRHLLLEVLTRHAVEELRLATLRQARLLEPVLDLRFRRAVEDGRGEVETQRVRRPPEVCLENLSDVHTRRHAERVEDDLHRRPIRQIRHVLFRQDARDDALVAVAAGHLVADRQLALHCDVYLHELDDARRQLVAAADLLLLLLEQLADDFDLPLSALLQQPEVALEPRIVALDLQTNHLLIGHRRQHFGCELGSLAEQPLAAVLVERVGTQHLADQHLHDALLHLVMKNADLVLQVLLHHVELFLLDRLRPVILLDALAGEDLHADDDALDAGRADERGVADVARLLAEDRAEQLLFRSELGLALRRHLADQDVARFDVGADADDAAVVEIAQVRLRHVGEVARDLFRPQLGVARLDLELLDVDGGVVVLLDHLLGDEDGVLEVVAAPRHEGDEHVPSERQLTELRARTVGEHLPLLHLLTDAHDRLLVDTGVLVRPLELGHRIDVSTHFLADLILDVPLTFHAHDDALAVDVVDGARAARDDHRTRIARGDVLHAGADIRAARPEQRHRLALHVRSHQRAVRVVVLEERDERGGDGDELLRRDVDELDIGSRREHEVASAARVDAVLRELAVVVHRRVGLGDDVVVLFPRREIEGVRLELDALLLRPAFDADHLVGLDDVVDLVLRVAAGVVDDDVVHHPAVLHLAVRRLDEAELVDARVARQRRDQADVRTFRRLNRTDAPVVRRVDVADLEAGALA